ncbi:N5-carboxyaminoimidazole ribonucleotide mutase [Clostridium tepidiprofundi DSM 19306]|uniref:N5-carboxyaminoimidazole ribonucleotide mutase n=2 Tax=Clostridium TaxID=1485 RepID=A0A151B330_9CLOT|nr:N5-carboxyaminoimidazole ribonucleotide mutase [Clostridium tepidiprofundi DSM 19306]
MLVAFDVILQFPFFIIVKMETIFFGEVICMKVAIIFGSKSDTKIMKNSALVLDEFGISYKAYILSAHRVPEKLLEVIKELESDGVECIIAGAGLAAHLPGVIASHTTIPVIGVPINAAVDGLDALLSIVQMPKSIPVATVGINNSYNAGMLAVQMLSLKYPELKSKLVSFRDRMKKNFIEENEKGVDFNEQ